MAKSSQPSVWVKVDIMKQWLESLRNTFISWLLEGELKNRTSANETIAELKASAAESQMDLGNLKTELRRLHQEMKDVAATLEDKQKLVNYALKAECPVCSAPWMEHRCPYTPTDSLSDHQCEICAKQLPISAVRTHLGQWRCAEHKNS